MSTIKTRKIKYSNQTIRWQSILILQIVRDNGGLAETRHIVDHLPEDESWASRQGVHYRMREKLIPAQLATKADSTVEKEGTTKNGVVYSITENGRDFLDLHGPKFDDAISMAEASKSLQRTRQAVDGLIGRVEDVEAERANHKEEMDDLVSEISGDVDRIDEEIETNFGRLNIQQSKLETLRSQNRELKDRIETLEKRVSENERNIWTLTDWVYTIVYDAFEGWNPQSVEQNKDTFWGLKSLYETLRRRERQKQKDRVRREMFDN